MRNQISEEGDRHAVEIAEMRRRSHRKPDGTMAASTRILATDAELRGAKGEQHIAEVCRQPWPRGDLPRGDIDFVIAGRTIDVKAASRPVLLVEEGKVTCDIYILVHIPNAYSRWADLVGWASRRRVLAQPTSDTNGRGIINHAIDPADSAGPGLQPIEPFIERVFELMLTPA